jgi:Sporulation and spore germination
MPRDLKIALGILTVAVLIGLISLRGLHQRMQGLTESQSTEEKARREVLAPEIKTPTDVPQGAKIYWAAGEDRVASTTVELALSADPVERGKQVLHALIADTPSSEQRTIPADAELLAFYILSDGTAIADFSDALSSETPSGIESEQLVVDSISQTLENNVATVRRLKILIHGQEVETLAGHLDLLDFLT